MILKMKDMIGVELPPAVAAVVEALQKEAAGSHWQPTTSPHITLVYPHQVPLRQMVVGMPEYGCRLIKATRRYSPIPLELRGVHHYRDTERNVVALKVRDETGALENLQRRLRTLSLRKFVQIEPQPRIPLHVTIGNYLTDDQAKLLTARLIEQPPSLSFTVDSLTYWDKGPGENGWTAVGSLPLRSR